MTFMWHSLLKWLRATQCRFSLLYIATSPLPSLLPDPCLLVLADQRAQWRQEDDLCCGRHACWHLLDSSTSQQPSKLQGANACTSQQGPML